MASPAFGPDSFSPSTRIALSVALIGVSALLVGNDVYTQVRGAHVVAQVAEVEVLHHARGGGGVRTHLRFRSPEGPMTTCHVGDIHARVGQMEQLRYVPPSSCAVAGDWRGIAMWSVFALVGVGGIAWTVSRRARGKT